MRSSRWRRRLADDRGTGTLEYLGMVVLAAILVGAVVVVGAGGLRGFPDDLRVSLCRLLAALGQDGSCEGTTATATPPTDEDFRPESCMVLETASSYNSEIKVWFVTLQEGSGFIVQQYADGTVKATLTDGAGIGVKASADSKAFDIGKTGGATAGASVELGAGLKFEYGSTWTFESAAQWTAMKDQLNKYLVQQESLKHSRGGGYALYLWLFDKAVDPPKPPSITYSKVGVTAALGMSASVSVNPTGGSKPAEKPPVAPPAAPAAPAAPPGPAGPPADPAGSGDPAVTSPVDLSLGAHLTASAEGWVGVETDSKAGTKSYTFEVSGEGEVGVDGVVVHGGGAGKLQGAMKTTYKDNVLVGIELATTQAGGWTASVGNDTLTPVSADGSTSQSTRVVTTTTLAVTDANRAIASQWLHDSGASGTLSLPFSAMVVDSPSSDPFEQLLYEKGRTSAITYHDVKNGWQFGLEVEKGWQLGFNVSAKEATATKTEASFLGAPRQDGVRAMIPDERCK